MEELLLLKWLSKLKIKKNHTIKETLKKSDQFQLQAIYDADLLPRSCKQSKHITKQVGWSRAAPSHSGY
jgi:hypothetical protein